VAKPELGTKRLCGGCGVKFYDLNKTPINCPKCGALFEVAPVVTRPRPDLARAIRPEAEVEPPEPEAELISLEEADAEVEGKAATTIEEAEVEDVEAEAVIADEDPFLEEQEEEETNVSEIIGGDIEDEEET